MKDHHTQERQEWIKNTQRKPEPSRKQVIIDIIAALLAALAFIAALWVL